MAVEQRDVDGEASTAHSRRLIARLADCAPAIMANPVLAYGVVLLLQVRVMWNVWQYRDTTTGDTSYYYLDALKWIHGAHDTIITAPLYTSYFGLVVSMVHNVATAVLVHRLIIVVAAAILVLALMRSLLGPTFGLIAGVWWVLVPANFDFDYEVHLFGMLPVLGAAIVLSRRDSRVGRGIALALLFVAAALVRPELLPVVGLFAIVIVASEIRARRGAGVGATPYLRAYGLPLLLACLLVGGAYWRSFEQGQAAWTALKAKHDLNMCQVYAYNLQQRHPAAFTASPWTECAPLMQKTFGRPMPSFTQEVRANPSAVAAFVGWNVHLLPVGLQVSLFGATSTSLNPGYFPVETQRSWALALTILVLVVVAAGAFAFWRDFEYWRSAWLARQRWVVFLLAALGASTLAVALTQRPRPEYIYGLTIGLMALTCMGGAALVRRWRLDRVVAPVALGAVAVLLIFAPTYYTHGPRPLHDALQRLQPIKTTLESSKSVVITSGYNGEICAYFARRYNDYCTSLPRATTDELVSRRQSLPRALAAQHANAIYADAATQADPVWQRFLATPEQWGWRQVAAGTGDSGRWSVLVRGGAAAPPPNPPATGLAVPAGLNDPRLRYYSGISPDGWLEQRSVIILAGGAAGTLSLRAQVLDQPNGQELTITINGRRILSRPEKAGDLSLRTPIPASAGTRVIVLHWRSARAISPSDPRQSAGVLRSISVADARG